MKSEDEIDTGFDPSGISQTQANRKNRGGANDIKRVHTSELAKIFKSKADIYRILMVEGKGSNLMFILDNDLNP